MQPIDLSKLSGVPKQEYNESTGKYDPLDLEKRAALHKRRVAIMKRQLMSEWQCTQCKRKCRGDGTQSSDGLAIPLSVHRSQVTEAKSDLVLRVNLEDRPVDLLESKPELLFCGFCGGPVIMTDDAGKLR